MTYLTYPDSVAVRHGACEEMYGLLHVIVVLELSRQMVARRPVAGLIRNGSRLRQTHQHFRSETWLPWYTAVLSWSFAFSVFGESWKTKQEYVAWHNPFINGCY